MYKNFNTVTDVAQNLINDFFLTLNVRGPFHSQYFKWKKISGDGVNFWKKTEALYAKLNERAEAATDSYSVTGTFFTIHLFCASHQESSEHSIKVSSKWIFTNRYFLMILIMVTEQIYWGKIPYGCFRFIWLWLLISIMKSCTERCALQLYHSSLRTYKHASFSKAFIKLLS